MALEYRQDMGLQPHSPLNPFAFAKHMGVHILRVEQLPDLGADIRHQLTTTHSNCWSALTLTLGKTILVILNSAHPPKRTASNITHEISHVVLNHKPAHIEVMDNDLLILKNYDKNQENEADWLSGCLLLPRPALLAIRTDRLTTEAASNKYGVSTEMLRFRFNVSGVDKQMNRALRRI